MRPGLPAGPEDLTPGWLAAALGRETGPVEMRRIGEAGFTGGRLYRLDCAAGRWVAKLSPKGPGMRRVMAAANRREVDFYVGCAGGLPVPDCVFAAADAATGASVLLLEDLPGAVAGDFRAGLTAAQTRAAVGALAQVHAAWWGHADLDGLSGSGFLDAFDFAACWTAYPAALERLMPGVALPDPLRGLGDRIAADPAAALAPLFDDGPLTLVHRDPQADNLMFAADGSARILDWQFFGRGRGMADLGYLMTSSLDPALRRQIEDDLLGFYRRCLARAGIDVPMATCRQDYRQAALLKFALTVIATVRFDNGSPARRDWRRIDLERLVAFCTDHDIGAAVPA